MSKNNYIPIVRGGACIATINVPDEHYELFHTLFTEATGTLYPIINELVSEHRIVEGEWVDKKGVKRVMHFDLKAAEEDVRGIYGPEY